MNNGHIEAATILISFLIPKTGEEAVLNYTMRYLAVCYEREYSGSPVRANGDTYRSGVDRLVAAKNFDPPQTGNLLFAFYSRYTCQPPSTHGLSVHEPVDQVRIALGVDNCAPVLRRVRHARSGL